MRWMEFFKLLIEFVKAIAWPVTVAAIAVYFRDQIIAHLPRVTEVGPAGVKLRPPDEQTPHSATAEGAVLQPPLPEGAVSSAAYFIEQVRVGNSPALVDWAVPKLREGLAKYARSD